MPDAATAARRGRIMTHLERIAHGHLALSTVLTVLLVLALIALDAGVLLANNPSLILRPNYYLALGNSIAFGYQPNLDFTDGFADDVFLDLRHQSRVSDLVNYACSGENTTTMIHGNCFLHLIHHDAYSGPQLDAAISFLRSHSGRVAPITLDLGSNDVLPDWNVSACTPNANADADVAAMDANLTQVILPRLAAAIGPVTGVSGPNFLMLNYYNPYAKICPGSAVFVHQLNDHLAADAMQFHIPIVDVYSAFGGDDNMANNLCSYTWVCSLTYNNDIHPTTAGYLVIAHAVEQALGIPQARSTGGIGAASAHVQPTASARPRDIWQRAS